MPQNIVLYRGALPGSSDLKFLRTHLWLGPMGLASGAGSVALPTSFKEERDLI